MTDPRRSMLRTAALLPVAAVVGSAYAQSTPAAGKPRLLIHVSENDAARWGMALANAKNAQDAVGGADKVDIEIVSNGPSVQLLRSDSPIASRIDEASKSGVKVVACETAMRVMKLEKSDMQSSVAFVPAGIIELANRQQAGWAYVRP